MRGCRWGKGGRAVWCWGARKATTLCAWAAGKLLGDRCLLRQAGAHVHSECCVMNAPRDNAVADDGRQSVSTLCLRKKSTGEHQYKLRQSNFEIYPFLILLILLFVWNSVFDPTSYWRALMGNSTKWISNRPLFKTGSLFDSRRKLIFAAQHRCTDTLTMIRPGGKCGIKYHGKYIIGSQIVW